MEPGVGPCWSARGLVAAAVLLAASLLPGAAQAQEHGQGDGLIPPGDWTEGQIDQMLDLIERTEQILPALYSDPDDLAALGFHDVGVVAPGGYYHFINPDWFDDGHLLDPDRPESLVYQSSWNAETEQIEYQLVSAMFMATSDTTMATLPHEIAWWPGWHVHANICITDDWRFSGFVDADGVCTSGHPAVRPPMMHVWIVDNACGHRFGGIDEGGLHCDVHGGGHTEPPPGGGPPSTSPPSTAPPTTDPPTTDPSTTNPPMTHPGRPNRPTAPRAPPARPIRAQPDFTG
jgi:hypothetical protein